MSSEDAIRKGQAAQALLENQDFNIAIDTVRLEAFKGFANSEPSEKDKREEHYYLLQAIEKLKNNLRALVANARFEEHKSMQAEADAQAKSDRAPIEY
jgi:hypothetical protein